MYLLVFCLDATRDFASHLQQIPVFFRTTAPPKMYLLVFCLDATRDFASHSQQIPVFSRTAAPPRVYLLVFYLDATRDFASLPRMMLQMLQGLVVNDMLRKCDETRIRTEIANLFVPQERSDILLL